MSYLTSTRLSRAQYVVAIAGATGNLGREVSEIFLTSYRPFFSRVLALVRDPYSNGSIVLAAKGAELHHVTETDPRPSLEKALRGVDVVINVLGAASADFKDALFDVALKSGAKVYFPSEFGVDHRLNDFPGYDHPDWIHKAEHARRARERGKGDIKVISVYTGLFLETGLTPLFGFDTATDTYTSIGSPTQRLTLTSKADIGRALAELALIALSPVSAERIPDDVRIAGTVVSFEDVRDTVQRVRVELGVPGHDTVHIQSEDLEETRAYLRKDVAGGTIPRPSKYICILAAEGKMDFSTANDNEIVNPGQHSWKWTCLEDYVRAANGYP
ncbi:hypothetical protein B0H21DRAFT_729657 [Amylocystis lapponica]|nr:hypothetical protein B0H21DRAFT_729657 [Amylocystis lapponica]